MFLFIYFFFPKDKVYLRDLQRFQKAPRISRNDIYTVEFQKIHE